MIRKGTRVEWQWGNGSATGEVEALYKEDVSKTIDGTEVTRNATSDNPAYLIVQDDGGKVLKSASEVSRVD